MFGKCVLVILAVGVTGCTLLALRQSRLQAASEMVRIQLDIRNQDEELWLLRTQIAQQITPEQVRQMMADIGPLKPLDRAEPGAGEQAGGAGKDSAEKEPPTSPNESARPTKPKSTPAAKPSAPRGPSASSLDRRYATEKSSAGERARELTKAPGEGDQ